MISYLSQLIFQNIILKKVEINKYLQIHIILYYSAIILLYQHGNTRRNYTHAK